MRKLKRKLGLTKESIRRMTGPETAQIAGGRPVGCSWTCTDDANMCTMTHLAGGCTVTH